MRKAFLIILGTLIFFSALGPAAAQAGESGGQLTWEQIQSQEMDGSLAFQVQDLALPFGPADLSLKSGTIVFQKSPAPSAAVFLGQGLLKWAPTDPIEAQQLKRFAKENPFETEFDEAVLWFSEDLVSLVKAKGQTTTLDVASMSGKLRDRASFWSGKGTSFALRALEARHNPASLGFVAADINAKEGGRIIAIKDLGASEELHLGRMVRSAPWYYETWNQFPLNPAPVRTSAPPRPLVKITHHEIELKIDGDQYMSGKDTLDFEIQVAGLRAIPFDLAKKLRVSAVLDSSGSPLSFVQPPLIDRDDELGGFFTVSSDKLLVMLAKPATAGEKLKITVQFDEQRDEGKIIEKAGQGVFFVTNRWSWYPNHGEWGARRATYRMRFTYPSKYELVSIGLPVQSRKEGEWTIADWEMRHPVSVAGFNYGEFSIAEARGPRGKVKVYANIHPDDILDGIRRQAQLGGWERYLGPGLSNIVPAAQAEKVSREISSSLDFFAQYYGDYPYTTLSVSQILGGFGQGWPSLLYLSGYSFLDSTQRNSLNMDVRAQRAFGEELKAHETSHQWWGHTVAWKSYRDQWLSEGFAEYSGLLYSAAVNGDERLMNSLKLGRDDLLIKSLEGSRFVDLGPIWLGYRLSSEEEQSGYARLVYGKGAWVMHMLRCMVMDFTKNDDTYFRNIMRDFVYTHRNKAASTEDFKKIVSKHMGQDTSWFFDQWVYGTEIPTYKTSWECSKQDGNYVLNTRVLQEGVSPTFKAYLPIRIKLEGGTFALGKVLVQGPETRKSIPLSAKAVEVHFNYFSGVLTR